MGDPTPPTIGVVVGMTSEARCLAKGTDTGKNQGKHAGQASLCVQVTGGIAEQTQSAARKLVEMNVTALLSFGIAGGLANDLMPGDLVLPKAIVTRSGERFETHPAWRKNVEDLCGSLAGPLSAPLAAPMMGADEAVASSEQKTKIFEETGACAVDMESHHLARIAARAGVPFLVIRAIADPAGRTIPSLALKGLGADGNPRILPLLGGLMLRPRELPGLLRLAGDSAQAHATLRSVADAALPGFGFS